MSFPDTQQFIQYGTVPRAQVAGTVDMREYLRWLNDPRNGYGNRHDGELNEVPSCNVEQS